MIFVDVYLFIFEIQTRDFMVVGSWELIIWETIVGADDLISLPNWSLVSKNHCFKL